MLQPTSIMQIKPGYLIDGSKTGLYDNNTGIGRSANAGFEVGRLIRRGYEGGIAQLEVCDIEYSERAYSFEPWLGGSTADVNINRALAYSTEALKGHDTNGDGTVWAYDFGRYQERTPSTDPYLLGMPAPSVVGTTIDLNRDGKIDAGEMTAWQIYQDGQDGLNYAQDELNYAQVKPSSGYESDFGNLSGSRPYSRYFENRVDGKVTAHEAKMAKQELNRDPNAARAQLQQIYRDNQIAEAQRTFKMPPRVNPPKPPIIKPPIQDNLIQQLIQLLIQLLSGRGFGGFGATTMGD